MLVSSALVVLGSSNDFKVGEGRLVPPLGHAN